MTWSHLVHTKEVLEVHQEYVQFTAHCSCRGETLTYMHQWNGPRSARASSGLLQTPAGCLTGFYILNIQTLSLLLGMLSMLPTMPRMLRCLTASTAAVLPILGLLCCFGYRVQGCAVPQVSSCCLLAILRRHDLTFFLLQASIWHSTMARLQPRCSQALLGLRADPLLAPTDPPATPWLFVPDDSMAI